MEEEIKQKAERKFYVLRAVEVPMESIEKGDLLKIGRATPSDTVDEGQLYFAAKSTKSEGDGKLSIMVTPVGITRILALNELRLNELPKGGK